MTNRMSTQTRKKLIDAYHDIAAQKAIAAGRLSYIRRTFGKSVYPVALTGKHRNHVVSNATINGVKDTAVFFEDSDGKVNMEHGGIRYKDLMPLSIGDTADSIIKEITLEFTAHG